MVEIRKRGKVQDHPFETNTFFVGRLARYRYCNMDQVAAAALKTVDRILGRARD